MKKNGNHSNGLYRDYNKDAFLHSQLPMVKYRKQGLWVHGLGAQSRGLEVYMLRSLRFKV